MAGEVLTETTVDEEALQGFVEGVRGNVLRPGDPGYDDARAIWNGLIDRKPALIVQPTGAADVVDAVNFAREHDLLLSIKGGAHNVAGNAVNDGGLVIDLSRMRGVRVDPVDEDRARGGRRDLGRLDRETQLFGLAVPGGVVSTTGIAGLTLHGGAGHLRRKHGLSIDNLCRSTSSPPTASSATRARTRTRISSGPSAAPAATSASSRRSSSRPRVGPMVMVGAVFYPAEDSEKVVRQWRDYMAQAPDELSSIASLLERPARASPFPPEHHGSRRASSPPPTRGRSRTASLSSSRCASSPSPWST